MNSLSPELELLVLTIFIVLSCDFDRSLDLDLQFDSRSSCLELLVLSGDFEYDFDRDLDRRLGCRSWDVEEHGFVQ